MSEKFMIGTKFYRKNNSLVPEIIRLKKQDGDILYFNMGGYTTYLTQDEISGLHDRSELVKDEGSVWIRIINFFGNKVEQVWEQISESDTGEFVKFKVENIGVKMTVSELKDKYIRLIPDGFVTISNISYPINNGKDIGFDVMVTLNKFGDNIPCVICRQDCVDIFRFSNNNLMIPIGISIPKEACPKNMNYLDFMYSEKCVNFKCTAVYLDDSLNTILKYLGSLNKYNSTMKKLRDKYENSQMEGCKDNIYDLLLSTGFYEDFKAVFGVFTFPFGIDTDRAEFNSKELMLLNKLVNEKPNTVFTNASYCPYDRGIDTDKLGFKHLFINIGTVKESDVFLVAYDESEIIE